MFQRNPSAHWQDLGLTRCEALRLSVEDFNLGPQNV